jgi:hypothetical protein
MYCDTDADRDRPTNPCREPLLLYAHKCLSNALLNSISDELAVFRQIKRRQGGDYFIANIQPAGNHSSFFEAVSNRPKVLRFFNKELREAVESSDNPALVKNRAYLSKNYYF